MKFEKNALEYIKKRLGEVIPNFKLVKSMFQKRFQDIQVDAILIAEGWEPKIKFALIIEFKSRGEPVFLSHAITMLRQLRGGELSQFQKQHGVDFSRVVVAPFVSERGANLCKNNEIGYIDLSGNCFLRIGAYYIDKRTSKENVRKEKKILRELFSPKASRVVRVLLEEPKKKWKLYELAKTANVSLGYAHRVIHKLKNQEFIDYDLEHKIELIKPQELLDEWLKKYRISDNKINTFYTFQKNIRQLMQKIADVGRRRKLEHAMTLHSGASLIAPFVRFTDVHFYIKPSDLKVWIKELNLRPVEFGGTIHLIEPFDDGVFYKKQTIEGVQVVCNTQLYIDLYHYPARGKEQAEFLREHLKKKGLSWQ